MTSEDNISMTSEASKTFLTFKVSSIEMNMPVMSDRLYTGLFRCYS